MRRTSAPSSSKTGQRRAQIARRRGETAQNKREATSQTSVRKPQASLILPATNRVQAGQRQAQQQARRRRRTARQMRHFESLIAQMPRASLGGTRPWEQLWQRRWRPSHLVSMCLLILAIGGIGWVHYDEQWYVYREYVTIPATTYHSADELYQLMDVDGWNVFWLSPSSIRNRLIALPTITDAQVQIKPPHWVTINIEETEPVALWLTQDGDFWILPDGTALPKLDERYATLPRIIDPLREASAWGDVERRQIDPNVLGSALALLQQIPAIDNLYYNTGFGLNFHMPGSATWVYWGDGSNATQKYQTFLAIAQDLRTRQQAVEVVDIRFEKPVIR